MSQGGVVSFGCSGTITLTQAITVSTNVALTGVGAMVTISGNDQTRLFNVSPGVELALASLQITRGLASYGGAISNESGRLVLDGVAIVSNNAMSTGEGSPGVGGAIYSRGGIVIVSGCVFTSNVAFSSNARSRAQSASGGAICMEGGTLQIVNCLFQDNWARGGNGAPDSQTAFFGLGADAFGGAIYSSGTGAVQRCQFLHDGASGGLGAAGWIGHSAGFLGGSVNGAVLYNAGMLYLSECTFMNNVATGGSGGQGWDAFDYTPGPGGAGGSMAGAVIFNQGWLSLVNCTFANNAGSGGNGGSGGSNNTDRMVPGGNGGSGGLAAGGAIFNSAAAFLTNCTVVSHALVGGAGSSGGRGGTCPSAFCFPPPRPGTAGGAGGNGGTAAGAGLYTAGGTSVVVHCTFDGNAVSAGTYGFGGPGGGEGSRTAPFGTNGIPGASPGGALSVAGGNVRAANSIFSRSEGSTNCSGPLIDLGVNICSDQSACFTNAVSMKNQDAGLQSLADNGGWTMTAALLATSPALNRGSDAFAAATDQRAVKRPQGKFCDVGAYEAGHLVIEKGGASGFIRYGAPPGSFFRLQHRPNGEQEWENLGSGNTGDSGGNIHFGPIPLTNQVDIFRVFSP